MNLPSPIQIYFDADQRNDGDALMRVFAPGARVTDEGHTHQGRQAIAAWWRGAKAKYNPVREPLDLAAMDDVTRVRTRVTGQFPGSPVTLTFAFQLRDNQIVSLDIGA